MEKGDINAKHKRAGLKEQRDERDALMAMAYGAQRPNQSIFLIYTLITT